MLSIPQPYAYTVLSLALCLCCLVFSRQENVEGVRCDQCRVGTFHLDPTNPKGCTSCFCFGATDRCRSSEKRRTEVWSESPSLHLA